METRAPFVIVGAFVLAAILAVFGFVFWLHNTSGIGARTSYHIQFRDPVPGLLVGAAVLFNGIRVGEVTALGLATDDPRRVNATIAVATDTPVRPDTRVGLDFQGLTGVPVVALEGGKDLTGSAIATTLIAEPGAGMSMTQAAREALRKVDSVLGENSQPLKETIGNLKTFSEWLSNKTGKLDGILGGVERMTGANEPVVKKVVYDLQPAKGFPPPTKSIRGQLTIPEPTTVVLYDSQKMLLAPGLELPAFAGAQWSDSIPKMLQEKLIQSFENYDIAHPPLRPNDAVQPDYQLLIDLRSFQIAGREAELVAEVAFGAKIIDKGGKLVAARLFQQSSKLGNPEPAAAVAAFETAFDATAKALILWTVDSLATGAGEARPVTPGSSGTTKGR
ncbi:ABC-type transport auxiliary lipoprotein family protein [Rhodopseudomonas pseudopalustris]|uniref:Phospholipid/cholesterol/gamma-HCH transport system substrate-binding protein n=1 Tax=Rhodopseudomonas pseudopalustris TaxID=1513892 RepID=A0A1H8P1G6_9BRAD|nr:MlaD family protein [Rhodopseudomonas pseudopalustris]SEO35749.1 phospholipid/cholesterol/gamma-HCH transport system substrate-binding protein [Rhodopseudomonas pseudopalustris]